MKEDSLIVRYPVVLKDMDGKIFFRFKDFGKEGVVPTDVDIYEYLNSVLATLITKRILKDGSTLPKASQLFDLDTKKGEVVVVAQVNVKSCMRQMTTYVKKTLTLPDWLNEMVLSEEGLNCSKLLTEALLEYFNLKGVQL